MRLLHIINGQKFIEVEKNDYIRNGARMSFMSGSVACFTEMTEHCGKQPITFSKLRKFFNEVSEYVFHIFKIEELPIADSNTILNVMHGCNELGQNATWSVLLYSDANNNVYHGVDLGIVLTNKCNGKCCSGIKTKGTFCK